MAFCNKVFTFARSTVQYRKLPTRLPTALYLRRRFGCNVPVLASADDNQHARTNILTSKTPKVDLIENKSFTEIIFSKFEAFGNKSAIVDGITGQEYSFPQIQELTLKCASALTKLGFKKGDVFAIYCTNVPEFPIIYLAVLSLGGIATTVSSLATVHEMCVQIKDSKAKCIFTVAPFASNAKQVAKQCGIKEVFVVGEAEGCRPLSFLFQDDGKSFPKDVKINPKEDIAAMPYSSGTTGLPKGVMLTHFNLSSNTQQFLDNSYHSPYTPDDNILGVLPFFHLYGLNIIQTIGLYCGCTLVTLPKFEENSFLETMQNFQISKAHLVPPLVLFLAKSPLVEKYEFPALDYVLSAAAPLSAQAETMLLERLKGISLVTSVKQGYGMTETGPVVSVFPVEHIEKVGAVGNLVSLTEAKVIDTETGEALGPNKKGEICVKGPQVMKGYLNNPEATNEALSPDGWIRTGDIGYYDSDEFFYIVDRSKELIKYKGYQVAPAELEAVLISHPKIHDAAVIGVEDEERGELPKAFVAGSGVTEEELHDYVNNLVSHYKKLRGGIEFIDEIPKSNTGKLLRRRLKDRKD